MNKYSDPQKHRPRTKTGRLSHSA